MKVVPLHIKGYILVKLRLENFHFKNIKDENNNRN